MEALFFFVAAFFSEIVGTIAGFGSSTVFLPLALFFFDFRTALVLVAFAHLVGNGGRMTFFRHGFSLRVLLLFGIPSVLATVSGAFLVPLVSSMLLRGFLGAFLILFACASLLREELRFPARPIVAVIGGALSGFIAGIIGTGGAIRSAFLIGYGLQKEVYIATAAVVAIAVDATRIPVYLAYGFLPKAFGWYLLGLVVTSLVGAWIGRQIVRRMEPHMFRRVVLIALFVIGIKFVLDYF